MKNNHDNYKTSLIAGAFVELACEPLQFNISVFVLIFSSIISSIFSSLIHDFYFLWTFVVWIVHFFSESLGEIIKDLAMTNGKKKHIDK